jgi:hypothetical protein
VFEGIKIIDDLAADAGLLQISSGVRVLFVDEEASVGTLCILKPTKVITNLGAKVVVNDGPGFNDWRGRQRNPIAAVNGLSKTCNA